VYVINRKTTSDGSYVAFEVTFNSERENFELFEDGLKDLLFHSCEIQVVLFSSVFAIMFTFPRMPLGDALFVDAMFGTPLGTTKRH
jgi:hypothetical protein